MNYQDYFYELRGRSNTLITKLFASVMYGYVPIMLFLYFVFPDLAKTINMSVSMVIQASVLMLVTPTIFIIMKKLKLNENIISYSITALLILLYVYALLSYKITGYWAAGFFFVSISLLFFEKRLVLSFSIIVLLVNLADIFMTSEQQSGVNPIIRMMLLTITLAVLFLLSRRIEIIIVDNFTKSTGIKKQMENNEILLQNIMATVNNLNTLSVVVNSATEESAKALDEIAADSLNITSSSTESLNSIQNIHQKIEGINNIVEKVTDKVHDSSKLAENMKTAADESRGITSKLEISMKDIEQSVKKVDDTIKDMAEHSNKIQAAIERITEIADQTNLLSLNAAIEAARAGEQGRGFAVVASEVKKLAENSKELSSQIISVIESSRIAVEHSEKAIKDQKDKVANGVEVSQQLINQLKRIFELSTDNIENAREITTDINNQFVLSKELRADAGVVERSAINSNEQVISLSSATEEVSASIEEVAASIKQLTDMTQKLKDISDINE